MKTTWVIARCSSSGYMDRAAQLIALFLQDWEVAKVALSCHIALDMLCQELCEVERRRGWFGFKTASSKLKTHSRLFAEEAPNQPNVSEETFADFSNGWEPGREEGCRRWFLFLFTHLSQNDASLRNLVREWQRPCQKAQVHNAPA